MTVHSFHIFDRRGKTLFTKRYVKKTPTPNEEETQKDIIEEQEQLSEQRKLVFGMLFSIRELASSLNPMDGPGDLQLVKTGASTLYNYETVSGLRFVLYTTGDTSKPTSSGVAAATTPQSSVHGGAGGGNSGHMNAPILTAPTTTGLTNSATAVNSAANDSNNINYNNSNHNSNANSLHGGGNNPAITADIRSSLKHIYEDIWVTSVIRSPMYRPNCNDNSDSIKSTNFEAEIDKYFKKMSWFR